ncbi:hypothetical protein SLE2022_322040 [Rubroshorea leprosula]
MVHSRMAGNHGGCCVMKWGRGRCKSCRGRVPGSAIGEGDTDDDANVVAFKIASNGGRQQEKEWERRPPVELKSLTAPTNLGSKQETRQAGESTLKRKYRRIFPWVTSTLQVAESGNPFMERHQTHSTFEH